VVSFTRRPLYLQGKGPWYATDSRLGGPQSRSGRGGKKENSQPLPVLEPPIIQPSAIPLSYPRPGRLLLLLPPPPLNNVDKCQNFSSIISDISSFFPLCTSVFRSFLLSFVWPTTPRFTKYGLYSGRTAQQQLQYLQNTTKAWRVHEMLFVLLHIGRCFQKFLDWVDNEILVRLWTGKRENAIHWSWYGVNALCITDFLIGVNLGALSAFLWADYENVPTPNTFFGRPHLWCRKNVRVSVTTLNHST
jgi:hypothetical protein